MRKSIFVLIAVAFGLFWATSSAMAQLKRRPVKPAVQEQPASPPATTPDKEPNAHPPAEPVRIGIGEPSPSGRTLTEAEIKKLIQDTRETMIAAVSANDNELAGRIGDLREKIGDFEGESLAMQVEQLRDQVSAAQPHSLWLIILICLGTSLVAAGLVRWAFGPRRQNVARGLHILVILLFLIPGLAAQLKAADTVPTVKVVGFSPTVTFIGAEFGTGNQDDLGDFLVTGSGLDQVASVAFEDSRFVVSVLEAKADSLKLKLEITGRDPKYNQSALILTLQDGMQVPIGEDSPVLTVLDPDAYAAYQLGVESGLSETARIARLALLRSEMLVKTHLASGQQNGHDLDSDFSEFRKANSADSQALLLAADVRRDAEVKDSATSQITDRIQQASEELDRLADSVQQSLGSQVGNHEARLNSLEHRVTKVEAQTTVHEQVLQAVGQAIMNSPDHKSGGFWGIGKKKVTPMLEEDKAAVEAALRKMLAASSANNN